MSVITLSKPRPSVNANFAVTPATLVFDARVSSGAKSFYQILSIAALTVRDRSLVCMGLDALAEHTGVSTRQLKRWTRELRETGYIEVEGKSGASRRPIRILREEQAETVSEKVTEIWHQNLTSGDNNVPAPVTKMSPLGTPLPYCSKKDLKTGAAFHTAQNKNDGQTSNPERGCGEGKPMKEIDHSKPRILSLVPRGDPFESGMMSSAEALADKDAQHAKRVVSREAKAFGKSKNSPTRLVDPAKKPPEGWSMDDLCGYYLDQHLEAYPDEHTRSPKEIVTPKGRGQLKSLVESHRRATDSEDEARGAAMARTKSYIDHVLSNEARICTGLKVGRINPGVLLGFRPSLLLDWMGKAVIGRAASAALKPFTAESVGLEATDDPTVDL